jgi:hypothetical protein
MFFLKADNGELIQPSVAMDYCAAPSRGVSDV